MSGCHKNKIWRYTFISNSKLNSGKLLLSMASAAAILVVGMNSSSAAATNTFVSIQNNGVNNPAVPAAANGASGSVGYSCCCRNSVSKISYN